MLSLKKVNNLRNYNDKKIVRIHFSYDLKIF